MEVMLAVAVTTFVVLFSWDIQFVPIRIVDRVEHKETFVFTVSMLKWPVLFQRKVYFVKRTQTWVIENMLIAFIVCYFLYVAFSQGDD
jgi:hypothetical protein